MDIHLDNNDVINIGVSIIILGIICTYGCCMYNSCKNDNMIHVDASRDTEENDVELTEIKIEEECEQNTPNEEIPNSNTIPEWAKREYLRDKNGKKKVFT